MDHNTLLLLYAALSVAGLVLLIVYFKVSAFLALIIASIFVGLCAGLEPLKIVKAFQDGVGGVLGSIAIIIGLGTILGKIFAAPKGQGAHSRVGRICAFGDKRVTHHQDIGQVVHHRVKKIAAGQSGSAFGYPTQQFFSAA